jgi:Sec-independent protein secretion pathway component TatC
MNRWKYAILGSLLVAAVIVPSPDIHAMRTYAAAILPLAVGVAWLVRRNTSS